MAEAERRVRADERGEKKDEGGTGGERRHVAQLAARVMPLLEQRRVDAEEPQLQREAGTEAVAPEEGGERPPELELLVDERPVEAKRFGRQEARMRRQAEQRRDDEVSGRNFVRTGAPVAVHNLTAKAHPQSWPINSIILRALRAATKRIWCEEEGWSAGARSVSSSHLCTLHARVARSHCD